MTAASGRVSGPKAFNDHAATPWALPSPLAANVAPSRNMLLGLNSAGRAVLQAAGVTGLVSLGFADRDEAASATAGAATALARQQFVSGYPNSTASLDAILSSDYAVACWAVDNQTVGKKSNNAGVNRSLLGVAFGLDVDNSTAIVYPGPIGWLLGRGAHIADNAELGSQQLAQDAAASTTTAESIMARPFKAHGTVTAMEFVPTGALTASDTDYATITIRKRDGAGGAATTVATLTTNLASGNWTAFTPKAGVLSATAANLELLETDVLTYQVEKASTGTQLPSGELRIVGRVG